MRRDGATIHVQVSQETHRELNLLRLAWDLRTLDDVIAHMLSSNRTEEIKALPAKIVEE